LANVQSAFFLSASHKPMRFVRVALATALLGYAIMGAVSGSILLLGKYGHWVYGVDRWPLVVCYACFGIGLYRLPLSYAKSPENDSGWKWCASWGLAGFAFFALGSLWQIVLPS
jgi:predicted cobalt transporter CbtA